MAFTKYILQDKVACPRCNADSQIRVEDKDDFCIVFHSCSMCRYKRSLKITTRRALKLQKRLDYYNQLLAENDKIKENYKILARIKKLQKEIDKEQLGIGVNAHGKKR